jgi:DNA-binding LacI/PurR family transcriptional regulator/DNA-binding transcriptional regulator YhcF (GntR family)
MDFELKIETPLPINQQIEKFLRKQIQQAHGDENFRLPSTKELAKKWGVSCTAIDQAMTPLVAEGLIERRRKRGTFIKGNAGQSVIGIVFGSNLSDEMAYFLRSLRNCLMTEIIEMEGRNWTTRIYDGLYGLLSNPDFSSSPACRNFKDDISNYSFKGIVLISRESSLLKTLMPELDLPMVRLGPFVENQPDVVMNIENFASSAIEHLAGKGIRRIAYLRTFSSVSLLQADLDAMKTTAEALFVQELKVHEIIRKCPGDRSQVEVESFESTLNLIKEWNCTSWPEAIVVSDDIAMRGVSMALMRNASLVPGNLELMTVANEGLHHHYGLPVTRYEFSPRCVAKSLVGLLAEKIAGKPLPQLPIKVSGKISCKDLASKS